MLRSRYKSEEEICPHRSVSVCAPMKASELKVNRSMRAKKIERAVIDLLI